MLIINFKKVFFLFFLSVIAMLTLTSCIQKKPITIGFCAGLTGSTSELGVNGRNGLLLAVEEINASGGINGQPVEVLVKDDQNDPKIALAVDQELLAAGVSFIIGHMTSNMAELSLPFVNEKDLLMISPTISTHDILNQDDHFISVVSSNNTQALLMAEAMVRDEKGKNIAVIYETRNQAYTGSIKDYLGAELAKDGGEIIFEETFQSGDNPVYLEISQRVLSANPDSIVILAASFDAAMFCQQFQKLGNQTPIYLPVWSMSNDLILQGGDSVEGVHIVSLLDLDSQQPDYLAFKKTYFSKYGTEPAFPAIYSYEAAMILFDAMKTTRSQDPQTIKSAIIEKSTHQGLQNEITINAYGDANRNLYPYIIKNGQFEKAE